MKCVIININTNILFMSRKIKRIVIITIFLMSFVIVIMLWWAITIKAPTCFDGKKNGNESGIDCGGYCAPCEIKIEAKELIIIDRSIVYGGVDKYDAVVKIKNPNNLYGASVVRYTMSLLDKNGEMIAKKNGEVFILPTQERFLLETNIESDVVPKDLDIKIDYVNWVKFTNYDDPDFLVQNVKYNKVSSGINYAEAFALVRNNSDFDFREVSVYVILKDENDFPIAVNATTMDNFQARDERDFLLSWPYRFPGTISNIDIGVYANVFDSENFIQQYLPVGNYERKENR